MEWVSFYVRTLTMPIELWRSEVESNQWTPIRMLPFTAVSNVATAPKACPYLTLKFDVVIVVEPTNFVSVFGGLTEPETEAVTALLQQLEEGG